MSSIYQSRRGPARQIDTVHSYLTAVSCQTAINQTAIKLPSMPARPVMVVPGVYRQELESLGSRQGVNREPIALRN